MARVWGVPWAPQAPLLHPHPHPLEHRPLAPTAAETLPASVLHGGSLGHTEGPGRDFFLFSRKLIPSGGREVARRAPGGNLTLPLLWVLEGGRNGQRRSRGGVLGSGRATTALELVGRAMQTLP